MLNIRDFTGSDHDYEILIGIGNQVQTRHPSSAEDQKRRDSQRDPDKPRKRFIAEKGGKPVAVAHYSHSIEFFHPRRFLFFIMVPPEYRNQGIGSALYDHMLQDMAQHEPLELYSFTEGDRPESIAWLEKRGYIETLRETETRLNIQTFDPAPFQAKEDRLKAEGIAFKSYRDLMTAPHHEKMLYDLEIQVEADIPASAEFTPMSFEMWQKQRSPENPDFLPDAYIIALDGEKYIGMSSLWGQSANHNLYVGITGIHRDYRRRGIAMALKVRTILGAQKMGGDRQIITWNERDNPMLQLNLKLGFQPEPDFVEFKKVLGEIKD